jgi:uncharacterized membrane protein YgcG
MAGRGGFFAVTAPSQFSRPSCLCRSLLLLATFIPAFPAFAETQIVAAQGEYRMGDRDTREDAVRLATETAKRDALEQVATYLESVTVIDGVDITKDEIRTYTAGLVLVLDQQISVRLDGDTVVVTVDLIAQVDTEEVAQAIQALRTNEDARHQLAALQEEIDSLHKELEAVNQALAQASTVDEVQQVAQQRQEILDRVQSDAMVAQAWTDWVIVAPVLYPSPWVGVAQATALLNAARQLSPNSPHVRIAQHEMIAKQPPLPLEPPAPATPSPLSVPVPDTQPVPASGPQTAPPTLNEVTHRATVPPQIGNQPSGMRRIPPETGPRTLTDVRQLNPFLPVPRATPPAGTQVQPFGSRSARALQQFLQPPRSVPPIPSVSQPPVARRMPPTVNPIHPPTIQQMPRTPFKAPPRGIGRGHGSSPRWGSGGAGGRGSGRGGGGRHGR